MERCEYNGSVLLQLLACGDLRWLSKACSGRVVPADDPSCCLTTSMTYSVATPKTFSPSCMNTCVASNMTLHSLNRIIDDKVYPVCIIAMAFN